jgi:hypothetical protein
MTAYTARFLCDAAAAAAAERAYSSSQGKTTRRNNFLSIMKKHTPTTTCPPGEKNSFGFLGSRPKGKVQFGLIYGLGMMDCVSIWCLLNLISHGIDLATSTSILGYCLLPMGAVAFFPKIQRLLPHHPHCPVHRLVHLESNHNVRQLIQVSSPPFPALSCSASLHPIPHPCAARTAT